MIKEGDFVRVINDVLRSGQVGKVCRVGQFYNVYFFDGEHVSYNPKNLKKIKTEEEVTEVISDEEAQDLIKALATGELDYKENEMVPTTSMKREDALIREVTEIKTDNFSEESLEVFNMIIDYLIGKGYFIEMHNRHFATVYEKEEME